MKKTPGANKATAAVGCQKHLRKYGKRLAHKAVRRLTKNEIKTDNRDGENVK